MKKFSLIVENQTKRYYKIKSELELIIPASNQGEAGYLADSTLSSIKGQSAYNITLIDETSKEDYENLIESYGIGFNKPEEEMTDEQIILKSWTTEFGDKSPTSIQKLEFYHNMRKAGFDGILIMTVLKNKLLGKN
jgi:hypothetical protein